MGRQRTDALHADRGDFSTALLQRCFHGADYIHCIAAAPGEAQKIFKKIAQRTCFGGVRRVDSLMESVALAVPDI